MENSPFGKKRLSDFYLDPHYVNINHASYGSCPRVVMQEKKKLQQQMDFNTEKWFRYDSQKLIAQTRSMIANRINCKTDNLFLVPNATDAYNSLVKSLGWKSGDTIVLTNVSYSSIRKTTQWLQQKYGIKILNIEFTSSDFQDTQSLILKVENTINDYNSKISLVILDHIVSVPGIVMPIECLVQFFKEKNIPVFIDGAHAICQVDIDLQKLEVDAYFSNFHKWAFSPKSAAFLYISDKYLKTINPAITANFKGQGLAREFFWTGTRDLTPYLVIDKALKYVDSFGEANIRNYNSELALKGANRIAQLWGTKKLTEDKQMMACGLNNILAPCNDPNLCAKITKRMLYQYNCFPAFYQFSSKIYLRISAQIFNDLSDYQFAAKIFLKLLAQEQSITDPQKKEFE